MSANADPAEGDSARSGRTRPDGLRAQTGNTGKDVRVFRADHPTLMRAGGNGRAVRALILTPTRELALQIYENVCQYARYTRCTAAVVFGGVSRCRRWKRCSAARIS